MASDRFRYELALDAWQNHFESGNFSVPSEQGTIAVLLPYLDTQDGERPESERFPALATEAHAIADMAQAQGRRVEVAFNAEPADFKSVLTDGSVSDVILIGHGCLSSVEVVHPSGEDRLDWENLSKMANHLKTGKFVQRLCATLPRDLNVPLGLMVVNDHRNVHALVGQRVTGDSLADFGETDLVPVTTLPKMEYHDIKQEFPKRKLSVASQVHVALGAIKNAVFAK